MIGIETARPARIEEIHAVFEAAGINTTWFLHTTPVPNRHRFSFKDEHRAIAVCAARALELIGIPTICHESEPWHPTVTYD